MSVSFAIRGFSLALAALVVLGGTAHADRIYPPPPPPPDEYYTGPPILRHIPGLRILFGDYALTEDEFNALYGKKKPRHFDESYYVPEPAQPKKKQQKPAATGTAAAGTATAKPATPGTAAKPAEQKTASAAGPLTCEKATEVVSGYGFSSVEASGCSGKLYAFNAKRDGKSFAIKLDPATGQLTEVKKLP